LNQAIKKRQEFMQKELGLKGNEKGLLKMLDNIERQKLVQDYADSSLRRYKPLKQEMFTVSVSYYLAREPERTLYQYYCYVQM
jgi:hypothetical protein